MFNIIIVSHIILFHLNLGGMEGIRLYCNFQYFSNSTVTIYFEYYTFKMLLLIKLHNGNLKLLYLNQQHWNHANTIIQKKMYNVIRWISEIGHSAGVLQILILILLIIL